MRKAMSSPLILVFDSGLGGLTVFAQVVKLRPDAHYIYVADDAGFPYGNLSEEALVARVDSLFARLIAQYHPDAAVIACNTASTLVMPHLRSAFPAVPFIGTVPAVKPAAELSRSHRITVLATPGTVARDYTHDLVRSFAAHCKVNLVGSKNLAGLAEAYMKGEEVSDEAIIAEIAPCFVDDNGHKTDAIALACTHYPLLTARFKALTKGRVGWPVHWIDPAPAIARRVDHILSERFGAASPTNNASQTVLGEAIFTRGRLPGRELQQALMDRGLQAVSSEPMPLAVA